MGAPLIPRIQDWGRQTPLLCALTVAVTWISCGPKPTADLLVITQIPLPTNSTPSAATVLDERYPPGSRIILGIPGAPHGVRVLSKGLSAAGGAVVCPSGDRVVFSGKSSRRESWQLYEARLSGGMPKRLTTIPGGAMEPAISGNGALIFSAPVPPPGATWTGTNPPALYAQQPGREPVRLTYGPRAAVDPTVLGDGRILFVSARAHQTNRLDSPSLGLFTINSDGTEFSHFALDRDGAAMARRPRVLSQGRIGFLAADWDLTMSFRPELVRMARPFATRAALETRGRNWTCVEGGAGDRLLGCFKAGTDARLSAAVYAFQWESASSPALLFDDPNWNEVEAVPAQTPTQPMGHVSSVTSSKATGTILCLDAHFSRPTDAAASRGPKADRVRITTAMNGKVRSLGELPLEADGSFLVEVPADKPIGFETLDSQGTTVKRLTPTIWVRSGESRTCLGCHEPSNRSPRNQRPLAVLKRPGVLSEPSATVSSTASLK